MCFANLLSELIENKGISKNALAKKAGISRQYLFDILAQRSPAPKHKVQRHLAVALNLTKSEQVKFFEMACKEREDFPADLALHYDTRKKRDKLRQEVDYRIVPLAGETK